MLRRSEGGDTSPNVFLARAGRFPQNSDQRQQLICMVHTEGNFLHHTDTETREDIDHALAYLF